MVGFGCFDQVIGCLLMANKMYTTVLGRDVSAVSALLRYGYKVYYGNTTKLKLLGAAGAGKTYLIVIICNKLEDILVVVRLCQ